MLGDACSFGSLPIRFGIVERLHRLFIILLAGHTRIKQMLLPIQFALGIVKNSFLLRFGADLLVDRGLLFQRIDGHQHLSSADMIARLHQYSRQRAVDLGLNGRGTPRLDRGHILVCLRHLRQINSLGIDRECLLRRLLGFRIAATRSRKDSQAQQQNRENAFQIRHPRKEQ